jgi:Fe-S cluster biosynthesis and repair protein YggX
MGAGLTDPIEEVRRSRPRDRQGMVGFPVCFAYFEGGEEATAMAEDGPSVRMVKCVKFGREMPGLERAPWKGELGKRIYENVSKQAWAMWVDHSKMLLNEYRLNPLDPNAQKIMEEQMEQFFFGEGAKLPEGYVAPKH